MRPGSPLTSSPGVLFVIPSAVEGSVLASRENQGTTRTARVSTLFVIPSAVEGSAFANRDNRGKFRPSTFTRTEEAVVVPDFSRSPGRRKRSLSRISRDNRGKFRPSTFTRTEEAVVVPDFSDFSQIPQPVLDRRAGERQPSLKDDSSRRLLELMPYASAFRQQLFIQELQIVRPGAKGVVVDVGRKFASCQHLLLQCFHAVQN